MKALAKSATRFCVHPNQVAQGKEQDLKGPTEVFAGKAEKASISWEAEIKELHAKIGQLTVGRVFLPRAPAPC
ncbi:hypothetical protein [Desulfocurvibacter africanus]|uniref:hypothetical protein n=1 Tax=Desulfocurvibacter africanus TaxID=873 RepID=UPI000349E6E7|nr:hypothetical protein [Desulfocurvibacter africanus]